MARPGLVLLHRNSHQNLRLRKNRLHVGKRPTFSSRAATSGFGAKSMLRWNEASVVFCPSQEGTKVLKQNQKGSGSTTQEPAGTAGQHRKASGPCHRTRQREEDLETDKGTTAHNMWCVCRDKCSVSHRSQCVHTQVCAQGVRRALVPRARAVRRCALRRSASRATHCTRKTQGLHARMENCMECMWSFCARGDASASRADAAPRCCVHFTQGTPCAKTPGKG